MEQRIYTVGVPQVRRRQSSILIMLAVFASALSVSAQQLEPVLVQGQPALKYTDKSGCESPIKFGTIAGQEEAFTIRVTHFHGGSWGEKGWLGITRGRIFFGPDTGQKDEHAFSIPRSEFTEAKVSKDHKIYYLTLISKEKKNQEFAIGCFGSTRDADDMIVPVLDFAVLASNSFEAGEKQFQQLTATVRPKKLEQENMVDDLLRSSSKSSQVELLNGTATNKEETLDAKTLFNLGRTHLKLQLYDEAVIAFKHAVQSKGEYAEAYNGLGDAYLYSGHPQEAIAAYTQAIRINASFAEAYNGLGIAYADTYQPEEALKALKQAIKLQPDSPLNFYFAGSTYKKLGKRKEAIEALREAVRLNPKYADAYQALGDLYSGAKEYAAAIEAYQSLVHLRPDSSVAHFNLASSYLNSGKSLEALGEYEVTNKLSPDDPSSYHNMGNAYQNLGRFNEAIENYKRAIALKPDSVSSHVMLGKAFLKNGDKAAALGEYNVLKSIDPTAAKVLFDEINK